MGLGLGSTNKQKDGRNVRKEAEASRANCGLLYCCAGEYYRKYPSVLYTRNLPPRSAEAEKRRACCFEGPPSLSGDHAGYRAIHHKSNSENQGAIACLTNREGSVGGGS